MSPRDPDAGPAPAGAASPPAPHAPAPVPLAKQIARGAIVASAAAVFTRVGFEAARVEDLLAAAGIARRTFYKYFTGKEEVLAALYDVATTELLKAIVADVTGARTGGSLAAVQRCMDLYLDYHVDNAALLKVLVEHAIRSGSPLAAARRRFRGELVGLVDAAVRVRTGKVNDPMLYAAIVSALEGLSLDLVADAKPPSEMRDEVARAKAVMRTIVERVLV